MERKYITNFKKSDEYRAVIHDLIPGGAHTYSKGDDQFPVHSPAAIVRGKGSHVWDADGNEYIECLLGLASVSLGHAYEPVIRRVAAELEKGNNFSRPSVIEREMAETFLSLIPGHDMIKFAKNGSVVTTAAVKIARAITGRTLVARPAEHPFYSYDDWFIGSTDASYGIPQPYIDMTVMYKADNLDSLREVFEKYPGQIACVISEPEKQNVLEKDYLKNAIDLAHKHGALYIADEMITGFRTHFPGSCWKYGAVPDMATWGKGIANGFSFCAMTGKKEVMEAGGIRRKGDRKLFLVSTTHGGETSSIAAGLATINEFKTKDVIGHNHRVGDLYISGTKNLLEKHGLTEYIDQLQFNWHAGMGFRDAKKEACFGMRTLFNQEVIKRGVLFQGIFCPCFSHTEEDVAHILWAFDEAMEIYKKALGDGYQKYLAGDVIKPVFRKTI
ncbi:MAG: glutamate-1-semialdehyde 2,1-aminomutase [Bacteroidetes bacterium]|nr:MAG: glutamate-1-semialdehyde 2,1-aminomutase [Bacteroidota bacterium]